MQKLNQFLPMAPPKRNILVQPEIDGRNEVSPFKITYTPQSTCDEMTAATIKCISRRVDLSMD